MQADWTKRSCPSDGCQACTHPRLWRDLLIPQGVPLIGLRFGRLGTPPERIKTWTQWFNELQHLEKATVQCCLRAKSDRTQPRATLHIFADASSVTYAVCAYLVTGYDSGPPTSILVAARAARARLRKRGLTFPRCELEGAVLASEMSEKHGLLRQLVVGQIVLLLGIKERSRWPLGKIVALPPSFDGTVREVEVFIAGKTKRRPIHLIAPLSL